MPSCCWTTISALAIQIATNLANDATDGERGLDGPRRLGPTRMTGSGLMSATEVRRGAIVPLEVTDDVNGLDSSGAEDVGQSAPVLVNALETGKYDPSLPLAFKIARLFGQPIEAIFQDEA